MENINVEEIMQEIREDIRKRGLEDKEIAFKDIMLLGGGTGAPYNGDAYKDTLSQAAENCEVRSYRELSGNPVARLIKKMNRRMIAFYIESIVDDQNKFNRSAYKAMTMSLSKFEEDNDKMAVLEKKLYECEKRIQQLEEKLKEK